ncbi:MAG: diaminopimelate epimerase [Bacteroidales bacterium]|nr:diaminopimelate epimerase [Bacteroidales bacterium]
MKVNFYKYQGTGNNFIIFDDRKNNISLSELQINQLCDRRFGIGADGLMLLENHPNLDFNMKYFNADGKESTMCGNGGRCLVAFAKSLNLIDKKANFNAIDGVHKATVNENNSISLQMQDVNDVKIVNTNYFLNTGSPHYVSFRDDIKNIDVYNRGREIRYSAEFSPEGTNVNFVEFQNDKLFVRTYERGVENETLSCGTGVTASAISASMYSDSDKNSYDIITKGGYLNVSFKKQDSNTFSNIWLTGPATFVFKGEIYI